MENQNFRSGIGSGFWGVRGTPLPKNTLSAPCQYNVGEQTGKKTNGEEVAREMRRARGKDGKRLFTIEESISSHQIASYLSRVTAKRRNKRKNNWKYLEKWRNKLPLVLLHHVPLNLSARSAKEDHVTADLLNLDKGRSCDLLGTLHVKHRERGREDDE